MQRWGKVGLGPQKELMKSIIQQNYHSLRQIGRETY